jgi:hypothetical protein
MSIYEPAEAASWMEDNWDNPVLTSIQNSGCGGPFAWMLSPEEPALAIFGCYDEPTVVNMAESLADLSGFPVVVRPPSDNPAFTLLCARLFIPHPILRYSPRNHETDPQNGNFQFGHTGGSNEERRWNVNNEDEAMRVDERTPGDSENGGRRHNNLDDAEPNGNGLKPVGEYDPNYSGARSGNGGGDDGGGPTTVDGKWEGPLHRTRVKLQLKVSTAHTYEIAVGYNFKVGCILHRYNLLMISLVYNQ